MTHPNQKIIITKKTLSDKENVYGIMNVDAMLSAALTLSDRAFKLFVRMMLHQDGFVYALSPVEIERSIGMSDKRYREAVNELIASGYLVRDPSYRNVYIIFESPENDYIGNKNLCEA